MRAELARPIVTAINAARKIGATAVPLNYRLSPEEAAYVTDHSDADRSCHVDAEFAPMFEQIRAEHPRRSSTSWCSTARPARDARDRPTSWRRHRTTPPPDPTADEAGATMIYTSGTTGKPKGALRRGGADPPQTQALLAQIGYTPDDVYLTTGPLYHSGPGGFMGIAQALGNTVVVQRKFDPEDWLRLVDAYHVTSTFAAPTPIRMVCTLPDDVKAKYDRTSMKRMIANAAPWSFALKQMYLADFPADSLFEVYGSTELGVNTVLEPQDQLRKPGSCGKAAPGVEIMLFDDDGNSVTGTGPDNPGELYVRSSRSCSPTTTSSTTSTRTTRAATTTRSATSRTATTRATSTSATARRT